MIICNEGKGCTSAGEERGRLFFLESRQNSEQSTVTPVSLSANLCSNELCISVCENYASFRIANGKMDTLFFLRKVFLLSLSNRFCS